MGLALLGLVVPGWGGTQEGAPFLLREGERVMGVGICKGRTERKRGKKAEISM